MVSSDVPQLSVPPSEKIIISIPFGLIGLPELTRFELESVSDSWPFQRLRVLDGDSVEIIVVEPQSVLESYPLEISDEDAQTLGLEDGGDALVLSVVAIHSLDPQFVTMNLVGPIVVNRKTLLGKQVIVEHSERYSVAHVLVDMRGGAPSPSEEAQ